MPCMDARVKEGWDCFNAFSRKDVSSEFWVGLSIFKTATPYGKMKRRKERKAVRKGRK